MALLEISQVSKWEREQEILHEISFSQKPLEKLAIAGATGSGKTTLLKIIAGLAEPTTGSVLFQGEKVKGPNERLIPGHPSIGYLSQYFELRNHYRVNDFLSMAAKVAEPDAHRIYEVCRISHLLERWTHQLSGGEKQRIALARILIASPQLLLLDEPYSNLDPLHKTVLKKVIDDLSNELKISCILVSHDPIDTLSWADQILILEKGNLIQKDGPQAVYFHPANEYAAALFGTYNKLSSFLAQTFQQSAASQPSFVRPQMFQLTSPENGTEATITRINFMGGYNQVEVEAHGDKIILNTMEPLLNLGDTVYIRLETKKPSEI